MKFLISTILYLMVSIHANAQPLDKCFEQPSYITDPIQYDKAVTACAEQKIKHISVEQCLLISRGLQYGVNADQLRLRCLQAKSKNIGQSCIAIQKQIEDPEVADQLAWSCVQGFRNTLSPTHCSQLAPLMSTQPQETRLLVYCLNELKQKPSKQECESISRKLDVFENEMRIQDSCRKKMIKM